MSTPKPKAGNQTGKYTPPSTDQAKPEDKPNRHKKQHLSQLYTLTGNETDPSFLKYSKPNPAPTRTSGITAQSSQPTAKSAYRFNVFVALEWEPNQKERQQLMEAFKRASGFLYDVTDGWMNFGCVIFGGMELMEYADIQLMASNRFNPRSWVNALNDPTKYIPIRVGRGVWHKNQRMSIPWVEPEGYRTLIHEWAHYALALRDEYLETHDVFLPTKVDSQKASEYTLIRAPYTLVVPSISLATESIMGSLEGTSELVPLSGGNSAERKKQVWQELRQNYAVELDDQSDPGPYKTLGIKFFFVNSPSQDPQNPSQALQAHATSVAKMNGKDPQPGADSYSDSQTESGAQTDDDSADTVQDLTLTDEQAKDLLERNGEILITVPSGIIDEHCWVYVVKYSQTADPNTAQPSQVVAQGTLDARASSDNFRLLNAKVGDSVVLIGDSMDGKPIVLKGEITTYKDASQVYVGGVQTWNDVTPPVLPFVDVVPSQCQPTDLTPKVHVHLMVPAEAQANQPGSEPSPDPEAAWFFPLGAGKKSANNKIKLAAQTDGTFKVWKSSDCSASMLDGHVLIRWPGNKLLICSFSQGGGPATHVAAKYSPITAGSAEGNVMIFFKDNNGNRRYGNVRVVTTLIYGSPGQALNNAEPRSYTFSVTSNEPLPVNLTPTLIMYFDSAAADAGGDLIIHRLDQNNQWQPMPTYIPSGSSFAAMPMDATTATKLVARNAPRVEHYRLFWVPRDGSAVQGRLEKR